MSNNKSNILVIAGRDDCELVSRVLGSDDFVVHHAESASQAMGLVDQPIDLVLCELCVEGSRCEELMRNWHERRPNTPFILIAGTNETAEAIEAMKHGAADYITKPVNEEELLVRVVKWLEASRKDERLQQLESRFDHQQGDQANNVHGIDIPAGTSLEELERAAVERALEQHRGNRTHAAKTLGISVRTLQRKLKAWHVPVFALQHQPSRQEFSIPMMR
jgi:DNA-binding NtrC family response regulator